MLLRCCRTEETINVFWVLLAVLLRCCRTEETINVFWVLLAVLLRCCRTEETINVFRFLLAVLPRCCRAGESIDGFVNVTGSKVAVEHNGHVRWMVPLIVNSACPVDVTYFPYDQQICEVKFGSWIYDLAQLNLRLTLERPDLEHYVMNSEYDLVNVSLTREVLNSSCCPGDGLHAMVNLKIHPVSYTHLRAHET